MITTCGSTNGAIGTQLQSLRIYAGLELQDAARQMRLCPSKLAAFEAGEARPDAAAVMAMAECYAVTPSKVFAIAAAASNCA